MRVLINALSARLGGGQTYLRNLLLNAPNDKDLDVFVLCPDSFDISNMPANVRRLKLGKDFSNPYKRAVWENLELGKLAKRLGVDVLFSPGGLLPKFGLKKGLKTVVTFQNLLPYDYKQRQRYPLGARRVRDWFLERGLTSAMLHADLVIFISEYAYKFIHHTIGPIRGRSAVIPHGIDERFIHVPLKQLPRSDIAPSGEYYLYVSFIDYYKSQIEVVRAFSTMRACGLAPGVLVLAGAHYQPYLKLLQQEIRLLELEDSVLLCGNIPHTDLPTLYQNAHINIFASCTENCPNILLEIMASGRPALISCAGPMPEFSKDAVSYFDPIDPNSLVDCWRRVVLNKEKANTLAESAKKMVMKCKWEVSAAKTWQEILKISG